jgi:hypothetical protein
MTTAGIPLHFVRGIRVLKPRGRWNIGALENVVGKPENYATRVSRLFIVAPEETTDELRLDRLGVMLNDYSADKSLRVEVKLHFGKLDSAPVSVHNDNPDAEHELVITIMNANTLRVTVSLGLHPLQEVLSVARVHYVTDAGPMPDRSLELALDRILTTGGHVERDIRVDAATYPYTEFRLFYWNNESDSRDRLVLPIRSARGA